MTLCVLPRSIAMPSFLRMEPSRQHSEANFWNPVAQSTWTTVPESGTSSSTAATRASLRLSADSSEIILETVNCESFSLETSISWPSFLITSAEKDAPNVLFSEVDSEKISFGSFFSEEHVTQLSNTSSEILTWPGL